MSLPIAWDNRDRLDSNRIWRCGTQPLRNWLAQLQQKQLRGALKMELPLSRKECALAVSYYNANKRRIGSYERKSREVMSLESLEAHCSAMTSAGQSIAPRVAYLYGD